MFSFSFTAEAQRTQRYAESFLDMNEDLVEPGIIFEFPIPGEHVDFAIAGYGSSVMFG